MVKIDNFLSIYSTNSTALENVARRSASGAKIYSKNAFGGEFDAILRGENSVSKQNSTNSVNSTLNSAKNSQNSVNFDINNEKNSQILSQNLDKNSIIANEFSKDNKADFKATLQESGGTDFAAVLQDKNANLANQNADEVAQSKAQARFDAALREQTDAFEAFLIKIILDVSLKKNNSLFGKDAGDEIYSAMYNDAVSKALSGGMGFSELLFSYLKERS